MPRAFYTWQRKDAEPGYRICKSCGGWGGSDFSRQPGYGTKLRWVECTRCLGTGQELAPETKVA